MDNKLIKESRELIYKEGDSARNLFLITHGEVLILRFSKERLIPVYIAKEGDVIGENAMLEGSIYQNSAISLSRVELIEMPSVSFKQVFLDSPNWLKDLTVSMVNRYQMTASLIADNKVLYPDIVSEDQYTPQLESEFKKLINQ
jgi:CRP-like cAMP-binding protein